MEINLLEEAVQPEKKRKIVSFVDPDARFGIKSNTKKFAGYKAHIVEDESGIVTSCETLKGMRMKGNMRVLSVSCKKKMRRNLPPRQWCAIPSMIPLPTGVLLKKEEWSTIFQDHGTSIHTYFQFSPQSSFLLVDIAKAPA